MFYLFHVRFSLIVWEGQGQLSKNVYQISLPVNDFVQLTRNNDIYYSNVYIDS